MRISVIIPTYNEEEFISATLDSLISNDISPYELEIIVADGLSTDKTPEILQHYAHSYPFIRILENKRKRQVFALNQMIACATGDYIVRCDAHAEYPKNYLLSLVNALNSDASVGNAGAPFISTPSESSKKAASIALAMKSKIGVGGSHRTTLSETPAWTTKDVDTLLFGAWRREIFQEVGLFDPSFIRGQDFEHNVRVLKLGKRVVITNSHPFKYFVRSTYRNLARQIFQYAAAKPLICFKHKTIPPIRSLAPTIFYLCLILGLVLNPLAASMLFLIYFITMLVASLYLTLGKGGNCNLDAPLAPTPTPMHFLMAVLIMHLAHCAGMLYGLGRTLLLRRNATQIDWESTR